ncbi:MAG: DUF3710 domain-containing protein, partial [Nocardioides sp.]
MKFRRKSATEPETPDQAATEPAEGSEEQASRPAGPYDVSEMPDLPEGVQRIDLGSLLIAPVVGTELRLQVDEASGAVSYVEHHRTLGDWVAVLAAHGFRLTTLLEPEWPEGHERVWGGWSAVRGRLTPGTAVIGC